jgi:hypothetical protein
MRKSPAKKSHAWIFAVAGAIAAFGLAAGIGIGWRTRSATASQGAAAIETAATLAKTTAQAPPPSPSASEMPVVSVDSLPGAKPLGPVPKGSGRLSVNAAPGWCALSVDGKERGPTPIAALDLAAGPHHLECRTPSGKTKATSLTVQDGANAKYKFQLDE